MLPVSSAVAVGVGDFNADGKIDIAASTGTAVRIFLGDGDGLFTRAADVTLPADTGQQSALAIGDLNGDGALDLAIAGTYLSGAYIVLGKGDGTFGPATTIGSVAGPMSIALGDLDGDGKLDVVLTDIANQSIAVLLGKGDGTFQTQHEYPVNGYPYTVSLADFNGDDRLDIAVANDGPLGSSGAGAGVLLNAGNGTFGSPVTYGPGEKYYQLTTEDIDGDGNVDLIVISLQPTQTVLIYRGNGNGTFQTTPVSLPASYSTAFLAITDLNNDGAPDILAADSTGFVNVRLQVTNPILAVSPKVISASVPQGTAPPASFPVTVTNSGGGTLNWTAASSQTWAILSTSSGTAPAVANVIVDSNDLSPGNYTANISVTGAGASNVSATVILNLAVTAPPVVLDSLSFDSNLVSGPHTLAGTLR